MRLLAQVKASPDGASFPEVDDVPATFEDVPAPLDREFARATPQAPEFLGLSPEDAGALAERHNVSTVRLLSLDDGTLRMHRDHRDDRLNLLVLRGHVVRAAFF